HAAGGMLRAAGRSPTGDQPLRPADHRCRGGTGAPPNPGPAAAPAPDSAGRPGALAPDGDAARLRRAGQSNTRCWGQTPPRRRPGDPMTTSTRTAQTGLDTVAALAAQLRVDSIRASTSAGSGHPTSSMSAADLLAVLITRHLHYDWDDPKAPANDHLI